MEYIWSRALESSTFGFTSRWRGIHPCITEDGHCLRGASAHTSVTMCLPSSLANYLESSQVKYLLVFLGDLEDLLDPLDPIKNITCYTLANTLPQVTFILQRQQNGLIVTSMITFLWSNPLKGFYSGDWCYEIHRMEIFKLRKPQQCKFISSWKYGLTGSLEPHCIWNQSE